MKSLTVLVLLVLIVEAYAKTSVWTERIHFTDKVYGNLEMIVDLGSSNSFLIEGRCENCPFRGINRRFYPEKSSTFKELELDFEQEFDKDLNSNNGSALGYVGEDYVGSTKKLRGQFGLIKKLGGLYDPAQTLELDRVAGRIGLSLGLRSQTNLLKHFFDGVDNKLVCFAPKCVENSNKVDECVVKTSKGQYLTDGYKNYTTVKVVENKEGYWQFQVESFKSSTLQVHSFNAILSTTTSDFVVPKDVFERLSRYFNVRKNSKNEAEVDCRYRQENIPFSFTVNHVEIPIQARDLISYNIWTKSCTLRVKEAHKLSKTSWVFGSVFTDSVGICLDFDRKEISFVKVL